ncbi:MAG: Restriction endonuclease [Syntrophorhabdus sp. PtaB.Bin184]|nr:MAG: Restriction endonuclease [Syntrophorhabdus sp. PtaB.Bin184]
MPRRGDGLVEDLIEARWWWSVIVAFLALIFLKAFFPAMIGGSPLLAPIGRLASSFSWWVFLFFLMVAGIAALRAWKRGELFNSQTSVRTLQDLSWRAFEDVVSEAYRRRGYSVMGNTGPGSDGGVDIEARNDGEVTLVQCKQWKAERVGVSTVREMFGLLNAHRANEVHIVTSGRFTDDAIAFAAGKPIKLIDGPQLLTLVRDIQTNTHPAIPFPSPTLCPRCGSAMVLKTARRGRNAGSQFWGCSRYPACRATKDLS